MDRKILKQYLAQAEDHIDDARRRIEVQTHIVEEMLAANRDAAGAESLLAQFKRSLESLENDRDLILSLLDPT